MVQATYLRDLPHAAEFGRLSGARDRRVHVQRSMDSIAMIVAQVWLEYTLEMPLVQHDDIIEELSADTADHPLDVGILPRTSWGIPPTREGSPSAVTPCIAHRLDIMTYDG